MIHSPVPAGIHVLMASGAAEAYANFTTDLALVLVFAAVAGVLFRRFQLPTLVGYLLAGVIIGPHTPIPVFADPQRIHALSDFGVILVMFVVGLEFTVSKFVASLPRAGGMVLLELSVMGWLGYLLGGWFGLNTIESLFLAASIAISSTMVVSKIFERTPPEGDVRELVFSSLVLQDVAAIVLITVLTAIAAGAGLAPEQIGGTLTRLGVFMVASVVVGLLLIPRVVLWLERIGSPETRVVFAVALCFGLGTVAYELGFSGALGAFLAGVLVAESGKGHAYEDLVRPVQDVFVAVFFVSVGMAFDPVAVWQHLGFTAALCGAIVLGQFLAVSLGGMVTGLGLRRSVVAGVALGQIGEFAFIMAGVGESAGVVPNFLLPALVAAAVLTSLTSSLAFGRGGDVAAAIMRNLPQRLRSGLALYEDWFDQLRSSGVSNTRSFRRYVGFLFIDVVVLVLLAVVDYVYRDELMGALERQLGLSASWASLVHQALVIATALPFVLGMARSSARMAKLLGEQLLPTVTANELDLARAPRRVVVVLLQLCVITIAGFMVLAFTQPFTGGPWTTILVVVVLGSLLPMLWRDTGDLDGHIKAGAQAVVQVVRRSKPTPALPSAPHAQLEQIADVRNTLPGIGHIRAVQIHEGAPMAGRTLGEIDLCKVSSAMVLVVARGRDTVLQPRDDVRLQPGDTLALTGSRSAVARAATYLLTGSLAPERVALMSSANETQIADELEAREP